MGVLYQIVVFSLTFILHLHVSNAANFPSGCAYEDYTEPIGLYTCDYTNATFPLTYGDFSNPPPQRMRIYGVSGSFTSPFSGFSVMTVTNTAYKAYLEIECVTSGTITLAASTFTDVTYIQALVIKNCIISDLPTATFANLNLDYLAFEGGSISQTQSDSFQALTISRLANVQSPTGALSFTNTEITGGNITSGFFDPLTTVVSITLDNAGVERLESTVFAQNAKLEAINLSRNKFTTIPNIFNGVQSLQKVNMSYIDWDCSCTNLWFTQWLSSNYVDLVGSYMCNTPASYQSKHTFYIISFSLFIYYSYYF